MSYQLILGDALEVMATLAPQSIDAIITDPPYKTDNAHVIVRGNGVAARIEDSFSVGDEWGYSLDWIDAAARLEPNHWVVYCNYRMLGQLIAKLEQYAKLGCVFTWLQRNRPHMARNVPRLDCEYVVWAKHPKATSMRVREFQSQMLDVPMLQAGCFATERILMADSKKAAHPTQKPLAVMLPFIERLTDPGQTVLDPFMGSGTTGVACIKTGRNFIGIERDEGYFAIAQRRIEQAQMQLPLALEVA